MTNERTRQYERGFLLKVVYIPREGMDPIVDRAEVYSDNILIARYFGKSARRRAQGLIRYFGGTRPLKENPHGRHPGAYDHRHEHQR